MNIIESIFFGKRKPSKPKTHYECPVHGQVSTMKLGSNGSPFCMRCAGEWAAATFPVKEVTE